MSKKTSIIMPCYNHEKYVGSAIESVLNQTYGNIELIAIDNKSTDSTTKIIKKFEKQDNRVVAIYHEKNVGLINSMNEGLEHISGDYISLISSDDLFWPGKTAEQVSALESNPGFDVVHSDADIIDGEGKKSGKTIKDFYRMTAKEAGGDIFLPLTRKNLCCTSTIIFKKECLSTCGAFDPELHYAQDWWFFLKLAEKHKFLYMDKVLADYRIHATNLTRNVDLVYADYVTIHSRLADMGIEPKSHLMTKAFSLAILGKTEDARAAVAAAKKHGKLGIQENLVAFIINNFKNSRPLLLGINKYRHSLMNSLYGLRRG